MALSPRDEPWICRSWRSWPGSQEHLMFQIQLNEYSAAAISCQRKGHKGHPGQEARAWGGCAMGATQLPMPPRPPIPRQFALTSKSPWLHTSLSLLFQSCCVWRLIPGLGKLTRTQHSTENKKKSSAIWFHLWAKVAHTHVSEIKYPTLALMQY
jgi:hypothetical protein